MSRKRRRYIRKAKNTLETAAVLTIAGITAGLLLYEGLRLRPGEENLNDRLNNITNAARTTSSFSEFLDEGFSPQHRGQDYIPRLIELQGVYEDIPYSITQGFDNYEDKQLTLGTRDSAYIQVTKQNTDMMFKTLPYERSTRMIGQEHPFSVISNEQYDTLREGLVRMHRNGETRLDSVTQDLWDRTMPERY